MADSDSEAFESADEEVEDKKPKKAVIHDLKEKKPEVKKATAPAPKTAPVEPPKKLSLSEPKKVKTPVEPVQKATPVEPPQKTPEEIPQQAETPSSWRSWGAFSVISNASKTVASITTQVSQSIIDSINIPDPEEMAKMHVEQKKSEAEDTDPKKEENSPEKPEDSMFKFDNLLSGVSNISSKVVSGGLGTLEGIGKKTINILQDTDPNIKNKIRSMNVTSKPNLSDLLKEAKDREDSPPTTNESSMRQVSFEHLLDEYKGLVYLEALEIFSSQSKMKIEILMKPLGGKALTEMEETLEEVKELCEFDAESFDESVTAENLEERLLSATEDLSVKLNLHEIVSYSKETQKWLENSDSSLTPNSIYERSIEGLAMSCALSLNNFQKLAELLMSQDRRSTADEADSLTQLGTIYCSLFNHFATKFNEKLTVVNHNAESKKLATNIFLESSNAISHIKDAFNMFIPILQIGAV